MTKQRIRLAPTPGGVCLLVAVAAVLPSPRDFSTGEGAASAAAPRAPSPPAHARSGTYVRGSLQLGAGTEAALRVVSHWTSGEDRVGPLARAEVTVRLPGDKGRAAAQLWRRTTDGEGVAEVSFRVPALAPGRYPLVVETDSALGHEKHELSVEIVAGERVLLESDKPIYQPGQTIHLRALALRPQDLAPVAGRDVAFELEDTRGNKVTHVAARTSRFGVASTDVALADDILVGTWKARVTVGEAHAELPLTVDRYRLPKFKMALASDKPWYAPGERARVTLDAKYFFGKPVADAAVEVSAAAVGDSGVRAPLRAFHGKTDVRGHVAFEIELPAGVTGGAVALAATVTDGAQHEERAQRELAIADRSLRIEAIPEDGKLVPGVKNRVFLVATRPDGAPASGVTLRLDDAGETRVVTDEVGMAEATLKVNPDRRACPAGGSRFGVDAGSDGRFPLCLAIDTSGRGLLVRTDHALYDAGAPITVEVQAAFTDAIALVDLIKEGQIVATAEVKLDGGVGRTMLPADPARFGTLSVRAYTLDDNGGQRHDARVIYVERPGRLDVTVSPDQASYLPGGHGRIHLHVADAAGQGVAASLGVVMVDESVLALRAVPTTAERAYFLLAREATQPTMQLKYGVAGYTMERLISGDDAKLASLRDRAARALLAGAAPPWPATVEVNPWQLRRDAWSEQQGRVADAVRSYARLHQVLDGGSWRKGLVGEMLSSGALKPGDGRDPWGKSVHLAKLLAEQGVDAPSLADEVVWHRMAAVYRALDRAATGIAKTNLTLTVDAQADRAWRRGPFIVDDATLGQLAQAGVPSGALVDPWGRPWRVRTLPHPVLVGNLASRNLVTSLGPDGKPDTADDVVPAYVQIPRNQRVARNPRVKPTERIALFTSDDEMEQQLHGWGIGMGGLGIRGMGAGGGGIALGDAMAMPMAGVVAAHGGGIGTGQGYGRGAGRLASLNSVGGARNQKEGSDGGEGGEVRVRSSFPETMLWLPEVLSDAHGDATVDVDMADSITTWLVTAQAVDARGQLGGGQARVRVFQDFFVDLDLPSVVTQHDELAVPVAVYNYLPQAEHIELELTDATGFSLLGERKAAIDLAPSQVGVRYFRVRAEKVGRHALTVHAAGASGTRFADAVRRDVEVFPDGVERDVAFADKLAPGASPAENTHHLVIPDTALADASITNLKLYPSMATHVIEGLDSMLRMPGGCFEQTSSTNYPNALILDYLHKTKQARPDVEKRAKEYLGLGYQRLLSFEVRGGGFSWFGEAPANQVLTAYGLQEFRDMSRVYPVDERVIERTQRWLVSRQRSDGSWAPDTNFINEGATNHFNTDVTRITAYIALSLERSDDKHDGQVQAAIARARGYVALHLDGVKDPYTLALAAGVLGKEPSTQALLDAVLERLWATRSESKTGASFTSTEKTPTYGDGKSGTVETTALAAAAMLDAKAPLGHVERAVDFLLGAKDSFGNWYSTQATILSLKALLEWQTRGAKPGKGVVHISVDGAEIARAAVDTTSEALQVIDLPQLARAGRRDVTLRYDGTGVIGYQLVSRYYEPHPTAAPRDGDLDVRVSYDHASVAPGESVTATIQVTNRGKDVADMPIVTAGLPPGCDLDGDDLEKLVADKRVAKTQKTAREAIFYLTRLEPNKPTTLTVHLRPRFPERVQAPPATVYEYYRPEHRASDAPVVLTVRG